MVLTTGGTGFGPRDVTPEATRRLLAKPAENLSRAMAWQTSLQVGGLEQVEQVEWRVEVSGQGWLEDLLARVCKLNWPVMSSI